MEKSLKSINYKFSFRILYPAQDKKMVLDIDSLRSDRGGDPDKVRQNQKDRFCDPGLVDTALMCDEKWKKGDFILSFLL